MNQIKSSVVSIFIIFAYVGASAQNFRQSIGIHLATYPVLYQDQRILSLIYTPGIEFQGRNSYLALTMPLRAGKVIPNHRPLNEYYRGLYAELAVATELGYDAGFLQKHKLQVFLGLSFSQINFNYIFQHRISGFVDLYVGCRRKLSKGALDLWVSAGEPFQSPAKRYGMGLSYVLP